MVDAAFAPVCGVQIEVVIDGMEYIRTATLEYPTGAAVRLEYDGRAGNVLIDGADTDKVTVQIVAHVNEENAAAADAALQRIVDSIRHSGSLVTITTPHIETPGPWFFFSRGVRVDYAITVPYQATCRVASRSGRVEVAHIAGPLEITQRSGRTSVRAIRSGVQVSSRSGSIEVDDVGADLMASSASGRVTASRIGGDARVQTASGSVRVEQVGGSLTAQSASGRIDAARVAGDARLGTASGRLSLSASGGKVQLTTVSGSARFRGRVCGDVAIETVSGAIDVDVDPRTPFYLDAETRSGSIRSDLPPRRSGPPPEGAPTVRLRTLSGAIRIGRHHALDTGLDLDLNRERGAKLL